MTTDVNYHPAAELLEAFAQGTLSTGLSVALSAHIELCASCREESRRLESTSALAWSQAPAQERNEDVTEDFSALIASIVKQPQLKELSSEQFSVDKIHMLEHSVTLPRALAKVASEGLVWKKLAGGINQAQVTLDDETQCEFIYMKPGSQVPVHKHQGNEITLVLDGSFSDELGHYQAADFVVRNQAHLHRPASEEGCLCFAVLDGPLAFTKGLARLFNPINRYRFRRATSQ